MGIQNRNSENDSLLNESQKFYNPTTDFVIGIAFIILVVGNVLLNFYHLFETLTSTQSGEIRESHNRYRTMWRSIAMKILALDFVSKNEKRNRKRRGAKCPRKGHTPVAN